VVKVTKKAQRHNGAKAQWQKYWDTIPGQRGCIIRIHNHPVHAVGVATPPLEGGESYGNQYINFLLLFKEEYPDGMSGGGGCRLRHPLFNDSMVQWENVSCRISL
jgi:hypothetical protein